MVNIYAQQQVEDRTKPFAGVPFYDQFFPRFEGPIMVQNSFGCGGIVSANGLVVMNDHVVNDATDIRAALVDRRENAAQVQLVDQQSGIAVRTADAAMLIPSLAVRDSDALRAGDVLVAINGIAISTPIEGPALALQLARRWHIDLIRRGVPFRLRFRL